jgi:hypothetical protein
MVLTTALTGTVSLLDFDLGQDAGGRRRDLGVDFVVEISNRARRDRPNRPPLLIQRTIVPSAIDSPIWGMTTGVDIGFGL